MKRLVGEKKDRRWEECWYRSQKEFGNLDFKDLRIGYIYFVDLSFRWCLFRREFRPSQFSSICYTIFDISSHFNEMFLYTFKATDRWLDLLFLSTNQNQNRIYLLTISISIPIQYPEMHFCDGFGETSWWWEEIRRRTSIRMRCHSIVLRIVFFSLGLTFSLLK